MTTRGQRETLGSGQTVTFVPPIDIFYPQHLADLICICICHKMEHYIGNICKHPTTRCWGRKISLGGLMLLSLARASRNSRLVASATRLFLSSLILCMSGVNHVFHQSISNVARHCKPSSRASLYFVANTYFLLHPLPWLPTQFILHRS